MDWGELAVGGSHATLVQTQPAILSPERNPERCRTRQVERKPLSAPLTIKQKGHQTLCMCLWRQMHWVIFKLNISFIYKAWWFKKWLTSGTHTHTHVTMLVSRCRDPPCFCTSGAVTQYDTKHIRPNKPKGLVYSYCLSARTVSKWNPHHCHTTLRRWAEPSGKRLALSTCILTCVCGF